MDSAGRIVATVVAFRRLGGQQVISENKPEQAERSRSTQPPNS
jgi:hypothetical protein